MLILFQTILLSLEILGRFFFFIFLSKKEIGFPIDFVAHKYNIFTYIYYDIASYLSYNATFLPKIDRKILKLHGKGYTIQRISNYLREHFEYPLNKKGRKGKPYSVFYVHTKLKYLKLLILVYAQTENLNDVKLSWESI